MKDSNMCDLFILAHCVAPSNINTSSKTPEVTGHSVQSDLIKLSERDKATKMTKFDQK